MHVLHKEFSVIAMKKLADLKQHGIDEHDTKIIVVNKTLVYVNRFTVYEYIEFNE